MKTEFLEAFKNLDQVLEDEIKVYRALLDVVRREKEILISTKVDELNDSNRAKDAIILKLRGLERLREKASRELAVIVGANAESPRLLEMAQKIDSPYNTRLQSVHQTLELLVKRIRDFNVGNDVLVQSALKTINGAMMAIRDTVQPKATYGQSGEVKREEVPGHFVSREV